MNANLTLVLGGARSGTSRHAETLIENLPPPWTYSATAQAFDAELREPIAHHRQRRGEGWQTVDAPLALEDAIAALPDGRPLLLDCLTLWLTNVMLAGDDVERRSRALSDALGAARGPWVVVSNEVGLGIVPDNALARAFRDAAGRLNQMVAQKAGTVVFMVAGLPMKVK